MRAWFNFRWTNSSWLTRPLALVLLITSVYAPFLGTRFIRMAGDEKVYVSQAVEMAQNGSWFVQRLQDEPNYYKGPLHYVLLRIGMNVFGQNPWAVLYMNLLLLIAGALAVAAIVRRHYPDWKGGDLWTGAAFALSTGTYAHAFVSQMEVELAALFAIGAWLLDRIDRRDAGWMFWTVAAIVGWIKSPLHSVFLGVSALIFWTASGEIVARIRNPRAWLAAVFGVLFCVAGYLPAFFLDRDAFVSNYVVRELLRKSDGSGQGWDVAVFSTFGFYLFPWVLLGAVAYLMTLLRGVRLFGERASRRLLLLGFSLFLPSVIFFCWHIYRFENYNLPVIAGVWLWIAAVWGSKLRRFESPVWTRAFAIVLGLTGALFLAIPVLITGLAVHFSPMPSWWPAWLAPWIAFGCVLSSVGFLFFGLWEQGRRPHLLALSSGGLFWALGALFMVIGEREMVDLRNYIRDASASSRSVSLGYYNLNRNIWSEWSFLGLWVGHEVRGLHTPAQLKEAILRGDTILITSKENGIEDFKEFVSKNFPDLPLRYLPWKRWRTRGQSESGKPLWREAWDRRDLSLLETHYAIVETRATADGSASPQDEAGAQASNERR